MNSLEDKCSDRKQQRRWIVHNRIQVNNILKKKKKYLIRFILKSNNSHSSQEYGLWSYMTSCIWNLSLLVLNSVTLGKPPHLSEPWFCRHFFFRPVFWKNIYLAALVLVVAPWIFHLHCSMWDLVPWPGIEPGPPALGALSPSHWTTREVLPFFQFCWTLVNIQNCVSLRCTA